MTEAPCTVEEHLARVLAGVRPLPPVAQPLLETLGLACAEDVVATIALPSFDNSAMDGYAAVSYTHLTLPTNREV